MTESERGHRELLTASQPPLLGMWHLALWIEFERFEATIRFYREGMNMRVVWQPDPDNYYLSSGADNLALHCRPRQVQKQDQSPEKKHGNGTNCDVSRTENSLDHLGFLVPTAQDVQRWHDRLEKQAEYLQCTIVAPVRLHRDGATSCYLLDPAGNKVQIVHIPEISSSKSTIIDD